MISRATTVQVTVLERQGRVLCKLQGVSGVLPATAACVLRQLQSSMFNQTKN